LLTGAGPGATPTIASTAVVPVAAAAPEGEDLGKKGSKKMKPQKGENGERKLDKSRFLNTPVGMFGRWGGATWSRSPLSSGR
jgi:hypothetical protein